MINNRYHHDPYHRFHIFDPKHRIIHKASVRDRLVHHAIYRILYPLFDRSFIFDSYSCRIGKGTHAAVNRLEVFVRKVSKNHTGSCWALKFDIKKFFDSVDHGVLMGILTHVISSLPRDLSVRPLASVEMTQIKKTIDLLEEIVGSYSTQKSLGGGCLLKEILKTVHLNKLLF